MIWGKGGGEFLNAKPSKMASPHFPFFILNPRSRISSSGTLSQVWGSLRQTLFHVRVMRRHFKGMRGATSSALWGIRGMFKVTNSVMMEV